MELTIGLEPTTNGLQNRHSAKLNYISIFIGEVFRSSADFQALLLPMSNRYTGTFALQTLLLF